MPTLFFTGWLRFLRNLAATLALLLVLVLGWPAPTWATGEQLFQNHCAGCHVHGGNVLRRNKTLKLDVLQRNGISGPAAVAAIAANGLGQMSAYGGVLGKGGAEAVARYVWAQAEAGWPKPKAPRAG